MKISQYLKYVYKIICLFILINLFCSCNYTASKSDYLWRVDCNNSAATSAILFNTSNDSLETYIPHQSYEKGYFKVLLNLKIGKVIDSKLLTLDESSKIGGGLQWISRNTDSTYVKRDKSYYILKTPKEFKYDLIYYIEDNNWLRDLGLYSYYLNIINKKSNKEFVLEIDTDIIDIMPYKDRYLIIACNDYYHNPYKSHITIAMIDLSELIGDEE
ncbi:MAG TPA: hypothetical protein PKY56_10990 [Candidatus Kapabacteria bacterium]|nr:hypothetical protein [Candidatus Kapabacteria bacterium]HPO62078.1 hypothetical protein [Candidatus Kapabacteria bacterium]